MKAKQVDHILAPVLLNEDTDQALEQAVAFALAFGADLDVLHVCETPVLPVRAAPAGAIGVRPLPLSMDELTNSARRRLTEHIRKLDVPPGVRVRPIVEPGTPTHEIVDRAADYSLVVLATREKTLLQRMLSKSTAAYVIDNVETPVLSVPLS